MNEDRLNAARKCIQMQREEIKLLKAKLAAANALITMMEPVWWKHQDKHITKDATLLREHFNPEDNSIQADTDEDYTL